MRVTIKDVAEAAGVSPATVSRVFNGYTDISAGTKERIMEIAKKMNYLPNAAARSLSSKNQITIGLVLNELEISRKNTITSEVLMGVYNYTEQENIDFVFLATSTMKQKNKSFQEFINEKGISGAVVQGLKMNDPYYKEIEQANFPVAMIDMVLSGQKVCNVSIDNETASAQALQVFIDHGHKAIGMVNGRKEAYVSVEREAGYIRALKKNKLPLRQEYVQYANYNEKIAVEITRDLLTSYPEITALFYASDLMAIGGMKAIAELGLKIPEDISIIGFDDIVLNEFLTPKLSSVGQSMETIGYEAAKKVHQIIQGKKVEKQVYIQHELIIRESVGKLRSEIVEYSDNASG